MLHNISKLYNLRRPWAVRARLKTPRLRRPDRITAAIAAEPSPNINRIGFFGEIAGKGSVKSQRHGPSRPLFGPGCAAVCKIEPFWLSIAHYNLQGCRWWLNRIQLHPRSAILLKPARK
jgi:hypothetical protein